MIVCLMTFHRLSQIRNLVRSRLPRPLCIKFPDRTAGQCRAVFPDRPDQIQVRRYGSSVLFCDPGQPAALSGRHAAAVKSQYLFLRKVRCDEFLCRRDTLIAHSHQCHPGILQLICCLQEIPAIRPEVGTVLQNQCCPRRAREAGDKLSALEIIPDVL